MYKKLLIAIDPENDAEGKHALDAAIKLLDKDGELHLVSVYSPGSTGFFPHVSQEAPEKKEAEVKQTLDELLQQYRPLKQNVNLHVIAGNTGEKLVGLAGQLGADLMILVSSGNSGRWPLRRATVEYVSVNAPCQVLILPPTENEITES